MSFNKPLLIVLAFSCSFFGASNLYADSAVEIYKQANQAIFLIETDQGGGSGFCINNSGLVATSLHVIDGAKQVSLSQSGSKQSRAEINLVAADTDHDLAILQMSGYNCAALPLANDNNIEAGQKVFVVGNPLADRDLTASITDGLVSGIRRLENKGSVIQISAPLSPGNSGGPVFDEKGHVIGIVAFKLTQGELLNFAVPVASLSALIKGISPDHIIFSWKSKPDAAYRSDAYKMPELADSIFNAAAKTSGTCAIVDATWTSNYVSASDGRHFTIKHIERKEFGYLEMGEIKDRNGNSVSYIKGMSPKGKWWKVKGKIGRLPLREDDIVNHLVDNWYSFCSEVKTFWRDVSVAEDSINGQEAYKVRVTEPFWGSTITFWFDKKTELVLAREYLNRGKSGPEIFKDVFSDFRKVDGFTIPFKKTQTINGKANVLETVSSFRPNIGYPDYMFEP